MKTTAILILALVMLLCLCACTPGPDLNDATKDPQLSNGTCSHSYQEQVTTEPGCTADGVKTLTCTHCGETHTESIAMLGHDISYGKCTRCGLTQYSPIEEGVWSYSSPNGNDFYSEVTFRNGTFVHVEKIDNGDHIKTYTGTYTIEGDTITLVYENAKGAIINLRRAYEDTLADDTDHGLTIFGHTLNLHKQ